MVVSEPGDRAASAGDLARSAKDSRGTAREKLQYSVLSSATIWAAVAVIGLVGAGVTVWLSLVYGQRLEVIKTASTIVLGTGGAAALVLAARRQRALEIGVKQHDIDYELQKQTAAATEAGALARRITEEYTRAADQLDSDKAARCALACRDSAASGTADQGRILITCRDGG